MGLLEIGFQAVLVPGESLLEAVAEFTSRFGLDERAGDLLDERFRPGILQPVSDDAAVCGLDEKPLYLPTPLEGGEALIALAVEDLRHGRAGRGAAPTFNRLESLLRIGVGVELSLEDAQLSQEGRVSNRLDVVRGALQFFARELGSRRRQS